MASKVGLCAEGLLLHLCRGRSAPVRSSDGLEPLPIASNLVLAMASNLIAMASLLHLASLLGLSHLGAKAKNGLSGKRM